MARTTPSPLSRARRRPLLATRRRRVLAGVIAAAVAIVALPLPAGARPAVYDADFPDPAIVRDGDTYHAYSTNLPHYRLNVPSRRSTDLTTWEWTGDVLPELGSWAAPGHTWAPAVQRFGDSWVLYYTARDRASNLQCIGFARASSPTGPFTDPYSSPRICPRDRGGAIDASVYVDPTTGQPWLLWKSDENAIGKTPHLWSKRLTADGMAVKGRTNRLLSQDRTWERPLVEQPEMVYGAGKHWLFYSANWWASANYGTGYAECSGPAGPCRKKTTSRPWHRSTKWGRGPGAAAFVDDEFGGLWMAYHGWGSAVGYPMGHRALFLERVELRADGPRMLPNVPLRPGAFADVPATSPHAAGVDWLVDRRITLGTGAGRFSPQVTLNRGQIATFLWRLAGEPTGRSERSDVVVDVADDNPHRPGAVWATSVGVASAPSGRFRPTQRVRRADMARFLWRLAGAPPAPPTVAFTDVPASSPDAAAIAWLAGTGVTVGVGDGTRFLPDRTINRAQMATFLHRFWQHPAVHIRPGTGPATTEPEIGPAETPESPSGTPEDPPVAESPADGPGAAGSPAEGSPPEGPAASS